MPVFRRSCKAILVGAVLCAAPLHASVAQVRSDGERSTGPFAARPNRIMSLNICTDHLLLALVPERRIASVTFMAREPQPLRLWPMSARIPVNYGSAEEVLAAKPDLVLTGPFMPILTRQLLERSGARIVEVPLAENFDQIAAVTRMVARALQAEARGEVLVAHMREDLRAMAKLRPVRPITVAQWGNGGYVPGQSRLYGATLAAMGARSITQGDSYYDVEGLLASKPQALLFADTYVGMATIRADQDNHPALKTRIPRLSYSSFYGCGVPQVAAAARRLQADLLQAVTP